MPTISQAGPTSAGYEGHVLDGAGKVHELDPSRNVDGTVVDGYESDERQLEDREIHTGPSPSDEPVRTVPDDERTDAQDDERTDAQDDEQNEKVDERTDAEREADENADRSRTENVDRIETVNRTENVDRTETVNRTEGGDRSSPGSSSSPSPRKTASTPVKKPRG